MSASHGRRFRRRVEDDVVTYTMLAVESFEIHRVHVQMHEGRAVALDAFLDDRARLEQPGPKLPRSGAIRSQPLRRPSESRSAIASSSAGTPSPVAADR